MGMLTLCCRNAEKNSDTRTPFFQRFACGVGHVMNDIIRQLLFSFRLVFFMNVLGLSAANAGWLMLYGLLVLAGISPVTAFLTDRINIPFLSRKLGRKKSWHLIGTVMEAIVMPLYFSSCFPCQSDGEQWQLMINVAILNTFLSFGFSLMEIGHLSIIPVIAKDQSEAVELNAWRTTFEFLGGIVTYLVAWAIFGQEKSGEISAENSIDFTVMTLILVGIGLVFALIFHVGTKEPSGERDKRMATTDADMAVPRKYSFIPSHTLLQSMTFMGTDVHCRKERMRDRFMDSVKNKDQHVTEDGAPVRKKSFARHFIDALFSVDDKEENQSNEESTSENKEMETELPPSQSKATGQDDDEMLDEVKGLPKERKISLLMSIVYGLTGVDATTIERLPTISEKEENGDEFNSCSAATCTDVSSGYDNKGLALDETELRTCPPDQITDTKIDEVSPTNVRPDLMRKNFSVSSETMKNKPSIVSDDPESALPESPTPKTIRAWLKDPHLYRVAAIFTCTMVLQDVSYAYLPLFLIYRVQFEKDAIAYLPLIMLTSATVSSGVSKKLVGIIGNKRSYVLASLLVIGAGVWFYFITQSNSVMTYPAVALLGFGFSTMFVNALSFAAELIGDNKSTSGVVFAIMSLMARVTGGALIITIQKLFPQGRSTSDDCEECGDYVRHVFSFVPGSLAAIGLLIVLLSQASQTICKQKVPETDGGVKNQVATDTHC